MSGGGGGGEGRYGGKIDFLVSSGNDTRNIVLIYRRETFLGELGYRKR